MSGKTHPIRKMQRACEKPWQGMGKMEDCRLKDEAIITRHVQPLLDALDVEHSIRGGHVDQREGCPVCRLLAGWKEPLR